MHQFKFCLYPCYNAMQLGITSGILNTEQMYVTMSRHHMTIACCVTSADVQLMTVPIVLSAQ